MFLLYANYVKYTCVSKNHKFFYRTFDGKKCFHFDFRHLIIPVLIFDHISYFDLTWLAAVLLVNHHIFGRDFDKQFVLTIYGILLFLAIVGFDLIIMVIFLEIQFYYTLYIFIISFGSIVKYKNQIKATNTVFPLVFLNFLGTWCLMAYSCLFICAYATTSLEFSHLDDQWLECIFILSFIIKLGAGPWYLSSFPSYKELNVSTLVFYVICYLMFLAPMFFELMTIYNYRTFIPMYVFITLLYISQDISRVVDVKRVFLYSSLFFFLSAVLLLFNGI